MDVSLLSKIDQVDTLIDDRIKILYSHIGFSNFASISFFFTFCLVFNIIAL